MKCETRSGCSDLKLRKYTPVLVEKEHALALKWNEMQMEKGRILQYGIKMPKPYGISKSKSKWIAAFAYPLNWKNSMFRFSSSLNCAIRSAVISVFVFTEIKCLNKYCRGFLSNNGEMHKANELNQHGRNVFTSNRNDGKTNTTLEM